ncbi:hypothetical protein ACHHYP_02118 [Achlya hypogyna]|uniref:Secreted protein n=1 Tax=Achlya hypogyna TaxID=1202772 RepID=A0A0A7CN62_ACHHY|nr:secreted protein [Achlya hypogyna]OQR93891.1 hypothetical protein ACHHYP_02118 [Achlya hypogyna]
MMSRLHQSWRLVAAVAALILVEAAAMGVRSDRIPFEPYSSCRVVVDAGSSGTRFFVFSSPAASADLHDAFPHLTPGLSDTPPLQAYTYMREALYKVQESIDAATRPTCYVHVYATAGMRLLSATAQSEIYNQLYLDFTNDRNMALRMAREDLRTISGDEEAYFLAMAANFLDTRVESDLAPSNVDLFGALDLGGGSTQIVFDVKERWRQNARRKAIPHQKPLNASEFYLHSFLGYGTKHMHAQVLLHVANTTTNDTTVPNPCWFSGYTDLNQTGTGRAAECIAILQDILGQDNAACPTGTFCALQSQPQPFVTGSFYAVSVFYIATIFARDVVAQLAPQLSYDWPAPSVLEIESAANLVCDAQYNDLAKMSFDHTPLAKLHRRCLDLCYVTALLKAYGFGLDEHRVVFVNRIRDSPLVWATGAYLVEQARASAAYENALVTYLSSQVELGLPVGRHIALLMLAFAIAALTATVHRAHGRHGTQAIEFWPDTRK